MKIEKLPSGNYRMRIYYYDDAGKRHATSVTAESPKEVIKKAAIAESDMSRCTSNRNMTIGKAVETYIALREPTCSPSTTAKYKDMYRLYFDSIQDIHIDKLTDITIQQWINSLVTQKLSAKTITNIYGLLLPSIKLYSNFTPNVMMPQKKIYIPNIPTEDDIQRIIEYAEGTPMELPIKLAAVAGMRMSEVCGLRWSDIADDTITIRNARVCVQGEMVDKSTKSEAGTRILPILPPIRDALSRVDHSGEYVVTLPMWGIKRRFNTIQNKLNIPYHIRFHDLRHYAASICSRLGIPDQYAMEYVGHSTVAMTHHYQHILKKANNEFVQRLSDYYTQQKQH